MSTRRRRTDRLPDPSLLPAEPRARARVACDALAAAGFPHAIGVLVDADAPVQRRDPHGLALAAARRGSAFEVLDTEDVDMMSAERHVAVPLGACGDEQVVLLVSDAGLARREAEAIAAWVAPPPLAPGLRGAGGGPCGRLARTLGADFDADVVVIALFGQSGMLVDIHVRSGALLRSWRAPLDTVWGEAARHGAAFAIGDLHLHPGAESLASLGLDQAGVVGLENGHGVAVGAVGVARRGHFAVDVARELLERAHVIGPQVMQMRSRSSVPRLGPGGEVDLPVLAARVGCRRFSVYTRVAGGLELAGAWGSRGEDADRDPDELEPELVAWAARQKLGVSSGEAAAIAIGGEHVLYARDPLRPPLQCLRLALEDLRRDPWGPEGQVDDGGGGHDDAAAA